MTRHKPTGRLVCVAHIAEHLGVTRGIAGYISEQPEFPDAFDVVAGARVWLAEDVEPWLRDGRPGPRRKRLWCSSVATAALAVLRERDAPVPLKELNAEFEGLGLHRLTVNTTLCRLARGGLARRVKSEGNRRLSSYEITAEGLVEVARALSPATVSE